MNKSNVCMRSRQATVLYLTCCKVRNVLPSQDIAAKVKMHAHWRLVVNAVLVNTILHFTTCTCVYKREYKKN